MYKFFDNDKQYNSEVLNVTFKNDTQFTMEIVCNSEQSAHKIKRIIIALRRIYEMDSSTKQNFSVEYNEEEKLISITGNIANALTVLTENKLISKNLYADILSDKELVFLVNSSKDFGFRPSRQEPEEIHDAEESIVPGFRKY